MTKKKRTILLSVMTAVLCLALVAGGTYALFSDQVTLTNHLEAGKLDITLTRTYLKTKSLNSQTGYLDEIEKEREKAKRPYQKILIAMGCAAAAFFLTYLMAVVFKL